MKKKLFLVHTVNQFMDMIYNPFAKPFLEAYPEVEVHNICDDSLLKDTLSAGSMPNAVAARILSYVSCAEKAGADAVMVTCTSVNASASYARKVADIPVFNIDEPMVTLALEAGTKIGVLGTLPTSPGATVRILEQQAKQQGKVITVTTKVAEGAFEALTSGNIKKHDEMVSKALAALAQEVDVVCFAQVSMSKVMHADCGKPVFKIGKSGFDYAAKILNLK